MHNTIPPIMQVIIIFSHHVESFFICIFYAKYRQHYGKNGVMHKFTLRYASNNPYSEICTTHNLYFVSYAFFYHPYNYSLIKSFYLLVFYLLAEGFLGALVRYGESGRAATLYVPLCILRLFVYC